MFIRFELIIFPILMMIFYFGLQPEKSSAIYYILLYTISLSMGFLYIVIIFDDITGYVNFFLSFYILGLFVVKCPIFGFHLWLIKAHVEAPTSTRILLAGLLLKVGLYGLSVILVFLNNIYT